MIAFPALGRQCEFAFFSQMMASHLRVKSNNAVCASWFFVCERVSLRNFGDRTNPQAGKISIRGKTLSERNLQMCGRYTLRADLSQISRIFQLQGGPTLSPRYNIAPTQEVAAVRWDRDHHQRELTLLRWGLIPAWAKDAKIGNRMINARAETIAEKPSFRNAFRKRRCLILADGFYEWQKIDGKKQPYFIHRPDDQPFAFAGLWEDWKQGEADIQSCTIITTTANAVMAPLHDRMPVILSSENYPLWLDPEFPNRDALQELLRPCDPQLLETYPVSTVVNSPRNESPQCVEPA